MSKKNKRKKNNGGAFGSSKKLNGIPVSWDRMEYELKELAKEHGMEMSSIVPLSDIVYQHENRN